MLFMCSIYKIKVKKVAPKADKYPKLKFVKDQGPSVVLCNHVSFLDVLVIGS